MDASLEMRPSSSLQEGRVKLGLEEAFVSGTPFKTRVTLYKKRLQYKFEQSTGRKGFLFQSSRHGIEDVLDVARWISPDDIIVDVGANIGQSAIRFRAAFPRARIISFEPIATTFAELEKATKGLGVECYNLALGSKSKSETMFLTRFSTTNSLLKPAHEDLRGTEQVKVITLDEFVREHNVGRIGLLKIDTEGFDLEVIAGGKATLSAGLVKFALLEVGFNSGDARHPLFDDSRDVLAQYGFRVFGIYNQNLEWTGEPSIRFANALFCRSLDTKSNVEAETS